MTSILVLAVLLAAGAASAQDGSALQAGDAILSTACGEGFTQLSGSARPGLSAPQVRESTGSSQALSTGSSSHVAITANAKVWCRADYPSALRVGQLILYRGGCREGFGVVSGGGLPAVSGPSPAGPPLRAGSTSRALVTARGGETWCAALQASALQQGDIIPRTDCRDWTPLFPPVVRTASMQRVGGSYRRADIGTMSVSYPGGVWCRHP